MLLFCSFEFVFVKLSCLDESFEFGVSFDTPSLSLCCVCSSDSFVSDCSAFVCVSSACFPISARCRRCVRCSADVTLASCASSSARWSLVLGICVSAKGSVSLAHSSSLSSVKQVEHVHEHDSSADSDSSAEVASFCVSLFCVCVVLSVCECLSVVFVSVCCVCGVCCASSFCFFCMISCSVGMERRRSTFDPVDRSCRICSGPFLPWLMISCSVVKNGGKIGCADCALSEKERKQMSYKKKTKKRHTRV